MNRLHRAIEIRDGNDEYMVSVEGHAWFVQSVFDDGAQGQVVRLGNGYDSLRAALAALSEWLECVRNDEPASTSDWQRYGF
jgi:hypothetical protein